MSGDAYSLSSYLSFKCFAYFAACPCAEKHLIHMRTTKKEALLFSSPSSSSQTIRNIIVFCSFCGSFSTAYRTTTVFVSCILESMTLIPEFLDPPISLFLISRDAVNVYYLWNARSNTNTPKSYYVAISADINKYRLLTLHIPASTKTNPLFLFSSISPKTIIIIINEYIILWNYI